MLGPNDWAEAIVGKLKAVLVDPPELWVEPGRALVADAGLLLTRVNSVKPTPSTTFINVDAGSNRCSTTPTTGSGQSANPARAI